MKCSVGGLSCSFLEFSKKVSFRLFSVTYAADAQSFETTGITESSKLFPANFFLKLMAAHLFKARHWL